MAAFGNPFEGVDSLPPPEFHRFKGIAYDKRIELVPGAHFGVWTDKNFVGVTTKGDLSTSDPSAVKTLSPGLESFDALRAPDWRNKYRVFKKTKSVPVSFFRSESDDRKCIDLDSSLDITVYEIVFGLKSSDPTIVIQQISFDAIRACFTNCYSDSDLTSPQNSDLISTPWGFEFSDGSKSSELAPFYRNDLHPDEDKASQFKLKCIHEVDMTSPSLTITATSK